MKLNNLFFSDDKSEDSNLELDNSIFDKNQQVNSSAKNWAVIAHLSAFLGYIIPLGHIFGPFLIYQLKKDSSDFVKENARAAFNFQVSLTLYILLASIIFVMAIIYLVQSVPLLTFGFLFTPIILFYVIELLLILKGVNSASSGRVHKYPFTINFLRRI